ncbi:MAG: hypothetical protein WBL25_09180, partial [Anaerolineales bacterium]
KRATQVEAWLEAFRTRVFGNIQDDRTAESLTGISGATLKHLHSGLQFALREGDDWLKFWIPDLSVAE